MQDQDRRAVTVDAGVQRTGGAGDNKTTHGHGGHPAPLRMSLAAAPLRPPRRWPPVARRSREGTYDRTFGRAAMWLLDRGIHPNHFTFLQIPVFAVQILAALEGWRWTFVLLIALLIILDGGDGILARVGGMQSRAGAILDSTFDTLGIAIVMWGAAQFFPAAEAWLLFLFLGNTVLYLQNALLGEKVIAYIRGPVLAAVAFPDALLAGLAVGSFIITWLLVMRLPSTWRALNGQAPSTRPGD